MADMSEIYGMLDTAKQTMSTVPDAMLIENASNTQAFVEGLVLLGSNLHAALGRFAGAAAGFEPVASAAREIANDATASLESISIGTVNKHESLSAADEHGLDVIDRATDLSKSYNDLEGYLVVALSQLTAFKETMRHVAETNTKIRTTTEEIPHHIGSFIDRIDEYMRDTGRG